MGPIIRVTAPTVEVLTALLESDSPAWGLKLAKATGRAPGSVYAILTRLEDAAWVVGEWEADETRGGPRRRLYSLTDLGSAAAAPVVAAWRLRHPEAATPSSPPAGYAWA